MRTTLHLVIAAALPAVLLLSACGPKAAGESSFSLPSDGETRIFIAGQSLTLPWDGTNIEACTAKPPKGWYATVNEGAVTIVAPSLDNSYIASGQVTVYARGTDKVEYVVYIPVRTEARLSKSGWNMVWCSSESPADYSGQKFTREDDPSSSMTGYATDLIDGSYSSIWAFNYGNGDKAPFYFVIDLGASKNVTALDIYAQRGNNNLSDPTNTTPFRQCGEAVIEFATTLSGNGMADLGGTGTANWSNKHAFYTDRLLNVIHNAVHLDAPVTARYIRFRYVKGYYKETDTAPTYTGGGLAELDLLGY